MDREIIIQIILIIIVLAIVFAPAIYFFYLAIKEAEELELGKSK